MDDCVNAPLPANRESAHEPALLLSALTRGVLVDRGRIRSLKLVSSPNETLLTSFRWPRAPMLHLTMRDRTVKFWTLEGAGRPSAPVLFCPVFSALASTLHIDSAVTTTFALVHSSTSSWEGSLAASLERRMARYAVRTAPSTALAIASLELRAARRTQLLPGAKARPMESGRRIASICGFPCSSTFVIASVGGVAAIASGALDVAMSSASRSSMAERWN